MAQRPGITDETIAAFRVAEQIRGGKTYAVFPYLRDGELVNVKYRNIAEKRDMRQEGGAEPCLFGWHLIDPKARTVAITEGEIDAMTLHQVGIPALSVNAGAGNHQWLENDWERLDCFSEILIFSTATRLARPGRRRSSAAWAWSAASWSRSPRRMRTSSCRRALAARTLARHQGGEDPGPRGDAPGQRLHQPREVDVLSGPR